ncbi:amidase [Arcticibacter eurypsychrophilus]|uniref:amidase n=1 Tax=Arcticibacter eurypsychrophilus TaxID=1434752 RepID=UPI00084D2FEC|nr:amidase [Arcticibacter eurypsychrophilus]
MKNKSRTLLIVCAISSLSFLFGAFVHAKLEAIPITSGIIKQAQVLIGMEFTTNEADSMIHELMENRTSYAELRKLNLPNDVVPALNFNPLPVGFVNPDSESGFQVSKETNLKMPVDQNDLAFYTVTQLAELIRTKQITSTALTHFFIARLKKYNGTLFNVITFTEEHALKMAAIADAEIKAGHYRGILHGIPFGAKDLLAQKDYATTFGAPPYKNQQLKFDATVITRLEEAGAILVAKTSLGELAMDDVWFGGKTKNPWDITRGSSGSSAGSASAVSAGCLPFAIGSETLGSIVSPSTECGTTGLRPSFGRVSKYGAMALSWSMDKLGPITRSVEDAAIVFNTIQGTDPKDLSTIAAPFNYDGRLKSLKGYKIGFLKADFDEKYENHNNDSVTLKKLKELGAELVPIAYPKMPVNAMTFILTAEAGAAFQELVLSGKDDQLVQQRKNSWPNIFRTSQFIPAVEYIQANRARTLLIKDWYEKLKGLDLYLSPSFSTNLTMTNLTGNPCVVLPNGFNEKGNPASITFMGQLFGEGKLLQAAKAYQENSTFNKHPSLNF